MLPFLSVMGLILLLGADRVKAAGPRCGVRLSVPRSRLPRRGERSDLEGVRRAALAAILCASVALIAAAAASASAAPTRAEFIHKGDALCRRVQAQLAPLRRKADAARSLPAAKQWSAVTQIWNAQIGIQSRFNAQFHALGVPSGDAAARRLVAGLDKGLSLARRIRDAFASRDTTTLRDALPAYLRFTLNLNHRVAAYGFTACGH